MPISPDQTGESAPDAVDLPTYTVTLTFYVTDQAMLTATAMQHYLRNGGTADDDNADIRDNAVYQFVEIIPDVPGTELLDWDSDTAPWAVPAMCEDFCGLSVSHDGPCARQMPRFWHTPAHSDTPVLLDCEPDNHSDLYICHPLGPAYPMRFDVGEGHLPDTALYQLFRTRLDAISARRARLMRDRAEINARLAAINERLSWPAR